MSVTPLLSQFPSITTAQRDALPITIPSGSSLYNSDDQRIEYTLDGSSWNQVANTEDVDDISLQDAYNSGNGIIITATGKLFSVIGTNGTNNPGGIFFRSPSNISGAIVSIIKTNGFNSSGFEVTYSQITTSIQSPTIGAEKTKVAFSCLENSVLTDYFFLNSIASAVSFQKTIDMQNHSIGNINTATIINTANIITLTASALVGSDSLKNLVSVNLSGDISTSGGLSTTLATVNANTGSWGTQDNVSTFSVNGKGLITSATNTPIQITQSQVTNLTTDLNSKLNLSGGTMTGNLILNSDATLSLQAVTFQQLNAAALGVYRLQGGYDPTVTSTYPTAADTTNPVSVIVQQGMIWSITQNGTIAGTAVYTGDEIVALVTNPGVLSSNWNIIQREVGYVPLSNVLNSANIFVGNGSNIATGVSLTGDASILNTGAITVTRTNGVLFAPSATTDTTNASNISSGTLSVGRLSGTYNIDISGNSSTVTTNANLTGDVTSIGNATTIANVNTNVGTFGDASHVPQFTVNSKGQITAVSNTLISIAAPTFQQIYDAGSSSINQATGIFFTLNSAANPLSSNFVFDTDNAQLNISGVSGSHPAISFFDNFPFGPNNGFEISSFCDNSLNVSKRFFRFVGTSIITTSGNETANFVTQVMKNGSLINMINWDGTVGSFKIPNGATQVSDQVATLSDISAITPASIGAPTDAGVGAFGTWGIDITGNSATVTTNANLTGDSTSVGNVTTVTKTNGVSFATSATTDTTNASNISSGLLGGARLSGTYNISVAGNASTVTTNANLTGDVTSVGNVTTLPNVNTSLGIFGDANNVAQIVINAKGQVLYGANVPIAIPSFQDIYDDGSFAFGQSSSSYFTIYNAAASSLSFVFDTTHGDLIINSGNGSNPTIKLVDTDSGNTANGFEIDFFAKNSSNVSKQFFTLSGATTVVTAGSETTSFFVDGLRNGTGIVIIEWAGVNGTFRIPNATTHTLDQVATYTDLNSITPASIGAPTDAGVGAVGTWGISISGLAATATSSTNSTNAATISTSTNASFFPLFVGSSSNGNQAFNLGTGLSFNPSTNTLTTNTITPNTATSLTLRSIAPASNVNALPLILAGANGVGATSSNGSDITITAGNGVGSSGGTGGNVYLRAGTSATSTPGAVIQDIGKFNMPLLTASNLVGTDASKNLVSISYNALNLAPNYVYGLNIAYDSVVTLLLMPGKCTNSTNNLNMVLASTVQISINISGVANGLDTGSGVNNTWYAVYVIADSNGVNATAGLLSANGTTPTLPSGYTSFRRVGWIRRNGSGFFMTFYTSSKGVDRRYYYTNSNAITSVLSAGNATTFTSVSLSAFIPPLCQTGKLSFIYIPTAGSHSLAIKDTGNGTAAANCLIQIQDGNATIKNTIEFIANSSNSIDYVTTLSSDSVSLSVFAFDDSI